MWNSGRTSTTFVTPILGEWFALRLGRFNPEKEPRVATGLKVAWAPELLWTSLRTAIVLTLVQPVL
jgi:hypothetical protein